MPMAAAVADVFEGLRGPQTPAAGRSSPCTLNCSAILFYFFMSRPSSVTRRSMSSSEAKRVRARRPNLALSVMTAAFSPSRNRIKKFLKKDKGVVGKRKQTFFKKFLSFPPTVPASAAGAAAAATVLPRRRSPRSRRVRARSGVRRGRSCRRGRRRPIRGS